ncbi:hypothetical protein Scep_007630 [Stephania cephalantha]|uniref:Uncharacterized protein n=1 Tax=Stephania cephalantha TaxID=152367 RepID=A0AAP0KA76_9MAGN
MKTKFNQNFKIEVQENANQDYDSKVLTHSREAIHESQRDRNSIKESRASDNGHAREPGSEQAAEERGPSKRRRRIAEASRRGARGERGPSKRRTITEATAARGRLGRMSGRITGPRSPVDGQRRRIEMWGQRLRIRGANSNAGGEDARSAVRAAANDLGRAGACGESRSTGVADERQSRRVAVDVDDGSGRRRRRWWRGLCGGGDLRRRRGFSIWVCRVEEDSRWLLKPF